MYYLYIMQCADESLYTGITTDLKRRLDEHNNSAKGAKYTSARRPVKIAYSKEFKNRSEASKEEARIKKLSRTEKMKMVARHPGSGPEFGGRKCKDFQKEIRKLKNPKKAKVLAGFFKTGKGQYGEGDKFLGVTVPQVRTLIKKFSEMSLSEIVGLLQSEFHEERLGALLIMVKQYKISNKKRKEQIFKTYLANTKKINSWDLVDLSADHIVGAHLSNKSKNILHKLTMSNLLWERRIAMLATFFDIKQGKCEIALLIAEKLLDDKEDLMHKAVGWMLREVGKRCGEAKEEEFLQKNLGKMSRTTLRYAIERFEEEKRQRYLKRNL